MRLLHGCFSRSLNCAHGAKLRNAPHIECYMIDVVLIYDENLPQTFSKTGLVEKFIESSNGKKRIANIRHILNAKTKRIS